MALLAWLAIRKQQPDEFQIASKPSAVILLLAGLSGIGQHYGVLETSGLSPNQKLADVTLTPAGIVALTGLIGLLIRFPPIRKLPDLTGID